MRVETVRGAMAVDGLGTTLMHEHVFVLTPDVMQNYGHEWWDEPDRVADAVRQLQALKDAGVDSIVDPTVVGLGRYIPRVQRVNEQVDINIIVATAVARRVLPRRLLQRKLQDRLAAQGELHPHHR